MRSNSSFATAFSDLRRSSANFGAPLALAAICLVYIMFAASYALPFPQYDDYSNLLEWAIKFAHAQSFSNYLALVTRAQQEHQQLLIKAFMALSLLAEGKLSLTSLIILGNLSWCVGVLFLSMIAYRASAAQTTCSQVTVKAWALLPPSLLCLNPLTYDSISFAAGANNFAYLALVVAAIYLVCLERVWALVLSVTLAGLSAYTAAPGFLAFPSLLLVLAICRRWRSFFVAALIMVLLLALYALIGSGRPSVDTILRQGPAHLIGYFLLFLGGMFGNISILAGYILGLMLFSFWVVVPIWTRGLFSLGARIHPALAALAIFCILVALGAALGRSDLGLGQAVSSRYALVSAILFVVTYCAVLQLFHGLWRTVFPAILAGSAAFSLCCYWLYPPAMHSQWNNTTWNARAYFDGGEVTEIPAFGGIALIDRAFESGIFDRAQINSLMDRAKPVTEPPIRTAAIELRTTGNAEGSLDSVGEAPGLTKLEGWAAIVGDDLLTAKRWLILAGDRDLFFVPATPMFRTLPGNPTRVWAGFAALVDPRQLPAGSYFTGVRLRLGATEATVMFPGKRMLAGYGHDLIGSWQTPNGTAAIAAGGDSGFLVRDQGGNDVELRLTTMTLAIPSRHQFGRVNADRTQIQWRDGTVWTRAQFSLQNNQNYRDAASILGQWSIYNLPCSIKHSGLDSGELILINENDNHSLATLHGRKIVAEGWNIHGDLSPDGRIIKWSNGTTWSR